MIPGIDVSHWQGEIDWKKMKEAGVKFAFIKASEFPDKKLSMYVDEKFKVNRQGAEENGIYWGAYHFFRTHIDPVHQAESFCEVVGEVTSLPVVLDLEVAGCKGTQLVRKVKSFIETAYSITGRKPIIYTSGGFWRPYMTYQNLSDVDWAAEYPLWMARYTSQWPAPIYPWSAWDFWQYSDHGRLPGTKANVDLNWFVGSLDDLRERFLPSGSTVIEEEEIEEEEATAVETVTVPAVQEEVPAEPVVEAQEAIPVEPAVTSTPAVTSVVDTEETTPTESSESTAEAQSASSSQPVSNSSTSENIPCLLSFLQYVFTPKFIKKKKIDPDESREWIEEVVYRDKKKR